MDSLCENALLVFNNEFTKAGLGNAPEGLLGLLKNYRRRPSESADACRKRMYKRLFGILWFGNSIGRSSMSGRQNPTYVYPIELKEVIRGIIQGELGDYADTKSARVYKVTLEDLHTAKWPVVKRGNN